MTQNPIKKALRVINSCQNEEQLASASRYAKLALRCSSDQNGYELLNKAIKSAVERLQPQAMEARCA